MDDITNNQDDNLGGLTLIKFAPVRFFKSIVPLVFNSGYDWINLVCTTESMQFDESFVDDDHCGHYNLAINGSVPKLRTEINTIIKKYISQPVIVFTKDMNGLQRLAGSLDAGLTLNYKSATGNAVSDFNGYGFQFTGKQRDPALFL